MEINLNDRNQEDVRRALEQAIRQANSNITSWAVEREIAVAALNELKGEEFEHYKAQIRMHDSDILFASKKLKAAEDRLAQLD